MKDKYTKDKVLVYCICLVVFMFCIYLFGSVSADYFNEHMDCDNPSYTYVNEWVNYDNCRVDDGSDATFTVNPANNEQKVYDFNLRNYCYINDYNLNVSYINVSIQGEGNRALGSLKVKISSNNGSSWSDEKDFDFADGVESVEYVNLSVSGWNIPLNYSNIGELGGSNWAVYMTCDSGSGFVDYVEICLGTNCSDEIEPLNDYTTFSSCRGDMQWKMCYTGNISDGDSSKDMTDLYVSFDGVDYNIYDEVQVGGVLRNYVASVNCWNYSSKTYIPAIVDIWALWTNNYLTNSTGAFFIDIDSDYKDRINSTDGISSCSNTSYDNLDGYANWSLGSEYFNTSFDIDISNDVIPVVTIDNISQVSGYFNGIGHWINLTQGTSHCNMSFNWSYNSKTNDFSTDGDSKSTAIITSGYFSDQDVTVTSLNPYGWTKLNFIGYYQWQNDEISTILKKDLSQMEFESIGNDNHYNYTIDDCYFYSNWTGYYRGYNESYWTYGHNYSTNMSCGGDECSYPWYHNFTIFEGKADVNITVTGCGTATNSTSASEDDFIYMSGLDMEPNFVAFVLLILFFIYGLAYSDYGYVLMAFACIMALSLGFYYVLFEAEPTTVTYWLGVVMFLFSGFCGFLALYLGLNFGRKNPNR